SARSSTEPIGRLWEDPGATLFVLGAASSILWADASDESLELTALVRHGMRAVIAMAPVDEASVDDDEEDDAPQGDREPKDRGSDARDPKRSDRPSRHLPLSRLLGFELAQAPLPKNAEGDSAADVA